MKTFTKVLVSTAIVIAYSALSANSAPDWPLEKKVQQADLVFIGTVEDTDAADPRKVGYERIAALHIDTLLKGKQEGQTRMSYASGSYELDPLCCVLGAKYLFFLKKDARGIYSSVQGPHGVYLLDSSNTGTVWPGAAGKNGK